MLGVDVIYHLSPSPSPFIPQTYIKKREYQINRIRS